VRLGDRPRFLRQAAANRRQRISQKRKQSLLVSRAFLSGFSQHRVSTDRHRETARRVPRITDAHWRGVWAIKTGFVLASSLPCRNRSHIAGHVYLAVQPDERNHPFLTSSTTSRKVMKVPARLDILNSALHGAHHPFRRFTNWQILTRAAAAPSVSPRTAACLLLNVAAVIVPPHRLSCCGIPSGILS